MAGMTPCPVSVHPTGGPQAVAARVVQLLASVLNERGTATFIGSAGRTPTEVYAELCGRWRSAVDWSRVHVVQMDDYVGVPPSHPLSLASYQHTHLVGPLGCASFTTWNGPDGSLARSVAEHDALAHTADVVLHGVGSNGHVGFNEPPRGPDAPSGVVELAESTRRDNGLPDAWHSGVTLGMATLLTARHSVVAAWGAAKRAAVAAALGEEPSAECPVSWLTTGGRCEVHVDADAGTWLHA